VRAVRVSYRLTMDLVILHGRAAAGKLTTGRALERRLGWPLFHNHLVVDLLTELFPFGSDPFVRLREHMWLSVIAEAAAVDRSLVFTFTPEPTVPAGFHGRVARVVESSGGRVLWVRLLVSDREQESRIVAADRQRFHKLTSTSTLRRLRSQPASEQPPADLDIDTEHSDPLRQRIASSITLACRPPPVTTATQNHQPDLQNVWTGRRLPERLAPRQPARSRTRCERAGWSCADSQMISGLHT
jgi:hypothetical protein